MKTFILILMFLNFVLCDLNYYYLYKLYSKKYIYNIDIIEGNIKYDGLFLFDTNKDNVCTKSTLIYIKKKGTYKQKFISLIHELTHYLQCIYSRKFNLPFSSVTNNKPTNKTIDFIHNNYNKSHFNEEYEAFYYSYNYKKFDKFEYSVLY